MRVFAQQGDTVDLLCHRHYGRTAGTVERVLEANAGLADHGPVLPQGLAVEMPAMPAPQQTATVVKLWE